MAIEQKLLAWDGKSKIDIQAIFSSHCNESGFADKIIQLFTNAALQKGASWLLKAWLETGEQVTPAQIKTIYSQLNNLEHWETKLHLLQCLPYMPVAEDERNDLHHFLRTTLTDTNKFIRAWSYNGFYELAKQYPEYRTETKQYFDMAMRDEPPSVKARIRNILKKDIFQE